MISIQVQVISTNNYQKSTSNDPNTTNDPGSKCLHKSKISEHIACSVVAQGDCTLCHIWPAKGTSNSVQ